MTTLPIFPLESELMPGMPLSLRVFEPRYRVMMQRVLDGEGSFGVVLIERGSEVGGGDQRFTVGTVARVTDHAVSDGLLGVLAWGEDRFDVLEWLPDDPYPQARVRLLTPLAWTDDLASALVRTERAVRRALATLSEFGDTRWPASVEVADDPLAAAWQLAGIAPLSPLDHVALLRSGSTSELLDRTAALAAGAAELAAFRLGDAPGAPDAGTAGRRAPHWPSRRSRSRCSRNARSKVCGASASGPEDAVGAAGGRGAPLSSHPAGSNSFDRFNSPARSKGCGAGGAPGPSSSTGPLTSSRLGEPARRRPNHQTPTPTATTTRANTSHSMDPPHTALRATSP